MGMVIAENNQKGQNVGPKIGSPLMRQPTIDWSSTVRYTELRNFRMKVTNVFQNCKSCRKRTHHKKMYAGKACNYLKLIQAEQEV